MDPSNPSNSLIATLTFSSIELFPGNNHALGPGTWPIDCIWWRSVNQQQYHPDFHFLAPSLLMNVSKARTARPTSIRFAHEGEGRPLSVSFVGRWRPTNDRSASFDLARAGAPGLRGDCGDIPEVLDSARTDAADEAVQREIAVKFYTRFGTKSHGLCEKAR